MIGDLEEQVLARPVSQEIPDVSDAGMLPAPKEPPMALTDGTESAEKKDESIIEDKPSHE